MPIEFACEECGSVLRVPDGTSGKRSRCPTCKHEQEIPWVVASGQEAVVSEKLSIPCPKCQHHLVCSRDLLGSRGQCKKCKHIFTISTEPVATESSAPSLVFHCPQCQQLFEGREEMRGRKGKCHVCKAVFMIKLEPAERKRTSPTATGPVSTDADTSTPSIKQPIKSGSDRPSSQKPATRPPAPAAPAAELTFAPTVSGEDELQILEEVPARKQRSVTPTQTPTPTAKPKPTSLVPIRFECSQCRGVMEVPGSTAGLDTECPYCKTIQTIPDASTPLTPTPQPSYPAATTDYSGSIYGSQPAMNQPAYDPLGGLDLGATNPYAAPTQAWSAPAAPSYGSGRSKQVTVGNVLQLGFDSLFPSCLMFFLHIIVASILSGMLYGLVFAGVYSLRGTGEAVQYIAMGAMILMMVVMGLISAWLAGAMSRLALNAVRKKPFDFADAFNPEGAFNSAIMVVGGGLVIMLVMYAPSILHMSTGILKGMEILMVGWIVLFLPVMMIYGFGTSLALFAGADGETSIESLQTSMSLIFKNFGTALGVLIISGLISGALAFFTFGASYVVPIYMTAALYHLAKKNS